jgi:DNA-binding MarR family transcriptional regulator
MNTLTPAQLRLAAIPNNANGDLATATAVINAAALLQVRLNGSLRRYGLTFSQYRLLSSIQKRGRCTASTCQHDLSLTSASISRSVRQLEERGLIQRVSRTGDRRVLLLQVHPTAADFLGEMHERVRSILSALSADDLACLKRIAQAMTVRHRLR